MTSTFETKIDDHTDHAQLEEHTQYGVRFPNGTIAWARVGTGFAQSVYVPTQGSPESFVIDPTSKSYDFDKMNIRYRQAQGAMRVEEVGDLEVVTRRITVIVHTSVLIADDKQLHQARRRPTP